MFELFDMPPDKYRFDIPPEHGPTSTAHVEAQNSPNGPRGGKHYYEDIKRKTERLVNFYNPIDTALSAWEFNQLTKPDNDNFLDDSREWAYEYVPVTCTGLLETCDVADIVANRFSVQWTILGEPIPLTKDYLTYRDNMPIEEDTAKIIGHILLVRTNALGQLEIQEPGEENDNEKLNRNISEISSAVALKYTNSNQDHSAQFHGFISEDRPFDGQVRLLFWENLTSGNGFELEPSGLSELGRLPQEKN